MKLEIKRKWIEALRSGVYKQCSGVFYDGECFCAMGVLYDIIKDDVGGHWDDDCYYVIDEIVSARIPEIVKHYLEIYYNVVILKYPVNFGTSKTIYQLNDDNNLSFLEIASLIETQL